MQLMHKCINKPGSGLARRPFKSNLLQLHKVCLNPNAPVPLPCDVILKIVFPSLFVILGAEEVKIEWLLTLNQDLKFYKWRHLCGWRNGGKLTCRNDRIH